MKATQLLQALIRIPSVSGREESIQKFIEKYIKSLGFSPILVGKNLVVHIAGKNNNKAILFNAHVDTVPAGDEKLWKYGPFKGKHIRSKVFGLGASDEKAAVATFLLLTSQFVKKKPACDIWLTFVVNEEVDGSGSDGVVKWFVQNHQKSYKYVSAVLGEPTNSAYIGIGHKGNVFLKITTHGDSGHGSKPNLIKHHAVEQMFDVAKKLQKLEKQYKKQFSDPILGNPTIGCLTSIIAGTVKSPNKFPDSCVATFDIRTTPKLHNQTLLLVRKVVGKGVDVDIAYHSVPCGYTDPNESIVECMKRITGAPVGVFSMGSSDLPFFSEANIPAILFGPGDPACCHSPNEYCELKNIEICVEKFKEMISNYATISLK